jgi:hypothetical protein
MHQHQSGASTQGQPIRDLMESWLQQLGAKPYQASDDDANSSLEGLEVRESSWAEWEDTCSEPYRVDGLVPRTR